MSKKRAELTAEREQLTARLAELDAALRQLGEQFLQLRDAADAIAAMQGEVREQAATVAKLKTATDTIADMRVELAKLAATVAKLPKYVDGRPFVPDFDEVWQWDESSDCAVIPTIGAELYAEHGKWVSMYGPKFYPTAAACEEHEGKVAR